MKMPEPIQDRFKQTAGNFEGLSPTDFTHFDFPPKAKPGNNTDDYNNRYKRV